MPKVMIVDDSAVIRQVFTAALAFAGIQVAGVASDPLFAMEKMAKCWPDIIVLDVEMPRMDGITFLKKIMAQRPTPVIICSNLTEARSATAIQALAAGAFAVIGKSKIALGQYLGNTNNELINTIKAAANANASRLLLSPGKRVDMIRSLSASPAIIAIGASTGGTQALEAVLTKLPADCPSILIVQHMPEYFTAQFARRLDSVCLMAVKEAADQDEVCAGRVLIAPGGRHMQLKQVGNQYCVEVLQGPPVNRHKPSVDVLFRSVAHVARVRTMGIILTGMGDDGARGLKEMRCRGASTIVQDEESCVVYGMPKAALALGAADRILPLEEMSYAIASV
ncbi:chemotaxis response regulator protein-glutamate methylesterase [Shewanella sp. CG12_big_fil_rev_8_21_14_0_65_47_15]|uniref:protein-glutamate methylesterase/protein-glutamine glutaminase n=1 Tax=Shewanella sp. CG12_big_fil_rev_8_21_14_0_65_47_15 TaxID=1975537 RepID=UPI000CBC69E3|nr:chemotaxis response regulator protein-glutamate methylesterase [Shewanella sp. CG12_big_fil_rev_8_21_14_0_65_47_15]PIW59252.1 MAG: chemotaxis response regulator protein-glutamate methylesterase [Shewanella sp. CG12_big_fil_rev_8_21_14_0_65_47_15]